MIFLSYCHKEKHEKDLVKQIYDLLNENINYKNKVFLDVETLKYGESYWVDITNRINDSSFFIFFNSKSYLDSATCWKELHIAIKALKKQRIKIIEVKTNSVDTHSCIPSDYLYIDLNDGIAIVVDKLIASFSTNDLIFKSLNKNIEEKSIILEILKKIQDKEEVEWNSSKIYNATINFLTNELKIISKIKLEKIEHLKNLSWKQKYEINNSRKEFLIEYIVWLES